MSLQDSINCGWQRVSQVYKDKEIFWYRSPQILLLKRALEQSVIQLAKGRVLDAGAGGLAYKDLFSRANTYFAVDINFYQGLDCLANIEKLPFKEERFDTVFCSQVLEHLPNPAVALDEFYRILRPGGSLIVSVPHLSCYHERPNDFYRFTAMGISYLLKNSGFKINKIQSCGSLFVFFAHIFSHIILGLGARHSLLRWFVLPINIILGHIAIFFDFLLTRIVDCAPLNIIAISIKYSER